MVLPNQVSEQLVRIANYIENNKNPKEKDVVNSLKNVVNSLNEGVVRKASHRIKGPLISSKLSIDVSLDDKFKSVMNSLNHIKPPSNSDILDTCCRASSVVEKIIEEIESEENECTMPMDSAKIDGATSEIEVKILKKFGSSLKVVKQKIDTLISGKFQQASKILIAQDGMKVYEFIKLLQGQDPQALIGISASYAHHFVNIIDGIKITDNGIICIDEGSDYLVGDEVNFVS